MKKYLQKCLREYENTDGLTFVAAVGFVLYLCVVCAFIGCCLFFAYLLTN